MKATEQYFPVVLFITLYKVVLTFESVDEILKCYHSNESYWAVLSCGAVYYAGWNPFKWKLLLNKVDDNWIKRLLTLSSNWAKACWDISPLLAFAGESVSSSS